MATRSAWVLNLDADIELVSPARYSPTRVVLEAMKPHVERLAASLLAPGDLLVDEATAPGAAAGLLGRTFCPTPRAIQLLRRAGAEPAAHPDVAVLRQVNGRAFCASLGPTLPGADFVRELDVALAMLERAPEISASWRLKRAFGMAGRGQRVVTPGAVANADLALLRAGMAEGGVQIEPNVAIVSEYGIHGMLGEAGAATFGRLVVQECDARGQWLATRLATDADTSGWPRPWSGEARGNGVRASESGGDGALVEIILAEAKRVAVALHEAGYFGPFGVDAYTYRDGDGRLRLQPRSEINARFSMGFAVGFGSR